MRGRGRKPQNHEALKPGDSESSDEVTVLRHVSLTPGDSEGSDSVAFSKP